MQSSKGQKKGEHPCILASSLCLDQHPCLPVAPFIEFLVILPQYRPLPQVWPRLPTKTLPLMMFLGLCADAMTAVKNALSHKGQRTA